jgi:Fe-S-cluster containining protein
MNAEWVDKLDTFYKELDRTLQASSKECGACDKCCKSAEVPYRGIEIDYVYDFLFRNNKTNLFEELVKLGFDWGSNGQTCLFYRREGKACAIYPARPYRCRVYGPFAPAHAGLPEDCVYQETVVKVETEKVAETLPLYKEYNKLAWEYQVYLKPEEKTQPSESK